MPALVLVRTATSRHLHQRGSFLFLGFEALRRFGEYEELHDGTLMRIEGAKEFRIYCEDVEGFPIRVMTPGFCAVLSEAYDRRMKEARESRSAGESLS